MASTTASTASPTISQTITGYLERLQTLQLPNGSWPYRKMDAVGFTEATSYALLAYRAAGKAAPHADACFHWLLTLRRKSGGYAAQEAVQFSNWTTSLVVLAQLHHGRQQDAQSGIDWLLGTVGIEGEPLTRALRNVFGKETPYPQNHQGWPWTRGAVSWIMPTVLGTEALRKANQLHPSSDRQKRVREGEGAVLERRCSDGGWNHGASSALGVDHHSYPETTGMALLCLRHLEASQIAGADEFVLSYLKKRHSAVTTSWLQLGLVSRGKSVPPLPIEDATTPAGNTATKPPEIRESHGEETAIQCRTTVDLALRVIALSAIQGNNIFNV